MQGTMRTKATDMRAQRTLPTPAPLLSPRKLVSEWPMLAWKTLPRVQNRRGAILLWNLRVCVFACTHRSHHRWDYLVQSQLDPL
jgi:hypothetical protein